MIWALSIAAAVTGLTAIRPVWGAAAIILLWPSYLIRTNVFGIPTTALELTLYGSMVALIVRLGLRETVWYWIRLPRDTWWILGFWGLAWALASFFADDRAAAFGALKAWWFDPLLLMGLVIVAVRTKPERHIIINAGIISGVIVAVAGLVQLAWFRETLQEGRLSSFFAPVANYAAMYLGPLLVLVISLMLHGQRTLWRWVAASIMFIALVLTLSFGAFMAVAAGVFFAWMLLPRSATKRRLAFIGAAMVLAGLIGLSQTKNFAQHFDFSGRSSGSARQQIWVTSWALIQQDPWFGVGPNNFESAYRTELPKHYFPPLEWLVAQPHNLFLALWLETGLLGLLVFGWFLWHHFRLGWQQFFHAPEHRNIFIASLAAIIAVVIHGLVDTTYFKNDLAMQMALFVVLPWVGEIVTTRNTVPQKTN